MTLELVGYIELLPMSRTVALTMQPSIRSSTVSMWRILRMMR